VDIKIAKTALADWAVEF